jgi:putative restriction endonuclease
MRYWWVNQNQTYRREVQGGYLWSPKHNANGARNPFYESMREVAPGDLIFSFMDTRILELGARTRGGRPLVSTRRLSEFNP